MTTIPTTEPTADPSIRLCVNKDWAPFVIGLLHPGTDPDHWWQVTNPETDPGDMEALAVGIERMIGELVQDSGVCVPASSCNPTGATWSNQTDFTSGIGLWSVTDGERTSNGLECRNPTGSLWRARAYLILPGPICIDTVELNYYWDAEFLVDPNPPQGNVAEVAMQHQSHPDSPEIFFQHINTNSNLNPTLRMYSEVDALPNGRFITDQVTIYLEGGHNATQAMAWIKSIYLHGRSL